MSDGQGQVSYVVPCYNDETYVGEAIRSICAQSPAVREIILVDDGSTDRSIDVATQACDDRLKVLRQENQGAAVARNAGIAHASSEFISFLDSDDFAPAGRDAALLAAFAERPDLDVVCGVWENFWIDELSYEATDPANAHLVGPQKTRFLNAGLIRRTAFDRFGIFDEVAQNHSMGSWVVLAQKAGMQDTMIEMQTMRRRIHANNMSRHKPVDELFDLFKLIKSKKSAEDVRK